MPSKPTKLPRWATAGSVTEPSEGKKDSGWLVAEKPPAQYFNWLFNLIYQWTAWLDDLTNQALTWTVAQIFSLGLTATGATGSGTAITATGGGPNGSAISGTGVGSGAGVVGQGGTTGPGVSGTGGSGNGGHGLKGTAGAFAGSYGVYGSAAGSGGNFGGGVYGVAGGGVGQSGITGEATTSGHFGVAGNSLGAATAMAADASLGTGIALSLVRNSTRGAIKFQTGGSSPSSPQDGDMWTEFFGGADHLIIRLNGTNHVLI